MSNLRRRVRWRWWLIPALALVLVVVLWRLSKHDSFQVIGELVSRVETGQRVVALTFDDGPKPPYTDQIVELLQRRGARATFFVVGRQLRRYPQIARRALRAGCQLANHSTTHARLVLRSAAFVRREIGQTDQLLRQLGLAGQIAFRAPYGQKLFVLPYLLWRQGRTHVLFDLVPDPPDYERPPAEQIARSVLEQVRPGSIILLHDGGGDRSQTVRATELIVDELQRRRYRLLTVDELLSIAVRRASGLQDQGVWYSATT